MSIAQLLDERNETKQSSEFWRKPHVDSCKPWALDRSVCNAKYRISWLNPNARKVRDLSCQRGSSFHIVLVAKRDPIQLAHRSAFGGFYICDWKERSQTDTKANLLEIKNKLKFFQCTPVGPQPFGHLCEERFFHGLEEIWFRLLPASRGWGLRLFVRPGFWHLALQSMYLGLGTPALNSLKTRVPCP